MATDTARIKAFCCNYTSSVSEQALKQAGVLADGVNLVKMPCTGRLEVPAILDALTEGADAVFVAGCEQGTCHNLAGSRRAAKRVGYARQILEELDIAPERVEMFFVPRGETEAVVEAAREMNIRVERLGPLHGDR